MADEALANADIGDMDVLPPPHDGIVIDNDDDVSLSLQVKQTLNYLPKIEPDVQLSLPPTSPPSTT